ncbi:Glycine cleavage system transcriptional activator [compost metagenome]
MSGSRKRLPPLNTIAAFEASARLMSFTSAAAELSLSQGAVSRQIQRLEERIGTALFERRHKKIELTKAGDIFYRAICESLVSIRRAVMDIERLNSTHVTISASLAMSSFWIMPAILKFKHLAPEINISILANDQVMDPSRDAVDLAILYGDGSWPDLNSYKLFDEKIFPVCSETYASEHMIKSIEDLTKCTLIEVVSENSVCGSWEEWFNQAGYTGRLSNTQPLQVSNYDLAYRAAEAGQGITLAWNYGPQEILRSKRLIRPVDEYIDTGMAEYLVTSLSTEERPAIDRVRALLIEYSKGEGSAVF